MLIYVVVIFQSYWIWQIAQYILQALSCITNTRKRRVPHMKKYTAPEVEVIKFQIQEAIADDPIDGSIGAAIMPSGVTLPNQD